ncbi:MAG TPA: tetratricopeptide repeat protein, partial [Burkholderiales bacterium]|nr:tetratricopeptide repeat protein [Burkholderiales bacterium]
MAKLRKAAADFTAAIQQAAICHQRGQLADAERLYTRVLAAAPDHFDALHLLGVLRQQQGRSVEALRLIAAALKRNADSVDALSNHGVVLDALTRHEEAVASYDRALALMPGRADVLGNRGNALLALGRDAEALASYEQALALRPAFAQALSNRGRALANLGRNAEAVESFDRALALKPDDVAALALRGNALFQLERHAEALASYDAALAIEPNAARVLNNRGYALLALARLDEALASYQAALALDPDYAEALVNCGNVLGALDCYEDADRHYDQALVIEPALAEAKWNKSLLHLSRGRFADGWPLYEQRWLGGIKGAVPRGYPQPRWNGEHMRGTLLVWGEQGLGDQILHAGMIPELAGRAGAVVLEVEPRLVDLFARSFPGVSIVPLAPDLFAGPLDAHVPIGSLGAYLRPDWQAFRPRAYLVADRSRADALRARLKHDGHTVVGLSWRSVAPLIGKSKSAQLTDFAEVLRMPGCRFVDLQYGDTRADRERLERELGV